MIATHLRRVSSLSNLLRGKKGLVLISSAVGAEDRGGGRSDGRQAAVKVSATLNIAVWLLCSFRQQIVLCRGVR